MELKSSLKLLVMIDHNNSMHMFNQRGAQNSCNNLSGSEKKGY
jgi:hypothetical protein